MAVRRIIKGVTRPVEAKKEAPELNETVPKHYEHAVKSLWEGESSGFNRNKSRTRIPVEEFNRFPEAVLTDRSRAILAPLRQKYGNKPFVRGNVDAGVLKSALRKGHLQHVAGDPASETCTFKFTAAGLKG